MLTQEPILTTTARTSTAITSRVTFRTREGYGTVTYDDPFTEEIETEGRKFNIEPEGTHYVTINFSGEKSLDISKENAESRYAVPDEYIEEGCATSVINDELCGQRVKKQFYAFIRVKGDTLNFDTYLYDGVGSKLYDTFTVKKERHLYRDTLSF